MKTLILCAALAVSLLAQNHPAWKDKPFAGDPAEMLKAAQSFPKVDSADVQVLLDHIEEKYDAKGAASFRYWRIYRVLTEDGAKEWGTVTSNWRPWQEDRPVLRCRAIAADGSVHQIDQATIAETADHDDANVLTDRKRLAAPIPAMAVGTLVEEEIVTHETRPAYEGGSMRRIDFDYGTPVQWARLVIETPQSMPLRYTLNKLPESAVTKTSADGTARVVIEHGPFEALAEFPPLLPSSVPRYHGVSFSTGESWQKFAERYSAVVDAQIEGSNLKSWTSNLKGSREEKISALMARVHKEIRYTGIEFGEAAIVPQKPNEVIKRKLGDCKDKSALLVALLRAAGIPAHVALLSTGAGYDVDPALPGGGLFNHAIAYVPGVPDYWIDATDEFAKLGEVDDDNQGRWALIASPDTTALKMIPEGDSHQNFTIEQREVFLPPFGDARFVETTEVRGAGASGFRQYYSSRDQKAVKEGLEAYAKNEYLSEAGTKWETADPHDLKRPFWLKIDTDKAKRGSVDAQTAAVWIPVSRLTDSLPEFFTKEPDPKKAGAKDAAPRKDEYVLRKPYTKEWRYSIHVPEGFRLRKAPEPTKLQLGTASLETEYGPLKDAIFTATLRFDSGKAHLSPEEAETARKAILELRKANWPVVEFEQTGEALLTQGKVLEALGEFKALCAKHPESALDRGRLARALLQAGIGEAAREEAKMATDLDPKSAKEWATRGWILQHDLIGRLRKPGFDREGALAAYRKAKELDPEEPSRADLAILLEHDAAGERYTNPAGLTEAIEEYKALTAKVADTALADNVLFALAYAGRFEELTKLAADGQQTQNRRALRLVAIAHLRSPEEAVKESFTWTLSDETRRGVLKTAGNVLLRLRNYPASADMMTAMAKNASNAAALLNGAMIIRKSKRLEDRKLDDADPTSVSVRFLRLLMTAEQIRPADVSDLFPKAAGMTISEAETKSAGREARKAAATADLPLQTLADIGISAARFSSDGDKDTAVRVKISFTPQTQQTQFLIDEDGRWKILATGDELGPLGILAREHAKAGRLTNARKLLDWARELTPAAQAEDPVQGTPFSRLWERGKEAGSAEILTAAAALASTETFDIAALEELRKSREPSMNEPAKRAPIDVALIQALEKRNQWDEIPALTARLIQDFPRSPSAFSMRLAALVHQSKFADARQLAEARLKIFPDDPLAIRALASTGELEGDFKTQRTQYARIEKLGLTNSRDLNSLIWGTLLDATTTSETVEAALRASQMSPNDFAVLHSAAAVMAQQGKTTEARAILLQAMQAAGMEEPEDNCWLVLGRIADEVGFKEVAKARYARIPKPKEDGPAVALTSYALAQKWMSGK